jgi:hypothetical protein
MMVDELYAAQLDSAGAERVFHPSMIHTMMLSVFCLWVLAIYGMLSAMT